MSKGMRAFGGIIYVNRRITKEIQGRLCLSTDKGGWEKAYGR